MSVVAVICFWSKHNNKHNFIIMGKCFMITHFTNSNDKQETPC